MSNKFESFLEETKKFDFKNASISEIEALKKNASELEKELSNEIIRVQSKIESVNSEKETNLLFLRDYIPNIDTMSLEEVEASLDNEISTLINSI